MTRQLEVNDWDRFDRYSSRIHTIHRLFSSAHSISYDIDPTIFRTLFKFRPGTPLFPSLRVLAMPKDLPKIFHKKLSVLHLMLPTLQTLIFVAPRHFSARYLNRLLSHPSLPQLRHLQISGKSTLALGKAAAYFSQLEYLDMNFHGAQNHFDDNRTFPHCLNQLSQLPSLTTLLISPPSFWDCTSLSQTGFRHLKSLAITGDTFAFTSICRMAPLIEHLVLEARQPENLVAWTRFFVTLQTSCPSLMNLMVYGKYFQHEAPIPMVKFIEPLFELSLRGFFMRSEQPIGIALSDVDIGTIVMIWPDLLALEMFPNGQYAFPDIPTMVGIKEALMVCGNLQHLVLSCWNDVVDLSTHEHEVSAITLDNTYPPFIVFNQAIPS